MDIIKDAFNDVSRESLPKKEGVGGEQYIDKLKSFQIGEGSETMRGDRSGLWLGAAQFSDAPFSVDMNGNVIASSIKFVSTFSESSSSGLNQVFTSGTQVDVTDSSISLVNTRSVYVLFLVSASGWVYNGAAGDFDGNGILRLKVDGSEVARSIISAEETTLDSNGENRFSSLSMHDFATINAGSHTIKLTGACDQTTGTTYFNLYDYKLTYIVMGNST